MPNRSITLARKDFETLRRVHVINAIDWSTTAGTDFWLYASAATGPLASSQGEIMSEHGWVTTSLTLSDGTGADFMTSADVGTPGEFVATSAADLLRSGDIFGDYAHAHQAAALLNHQVLPRYLCMDMYARWSVASTNETTTNIGFVEAGGTPVLSADMIAGVQSNGTNFQFDVNATLVDTGIAIVTTNNWWRIVLDKQADVARLYMNSVLVATSTLAITTDEFPCAFGIGNGTTNRVQTNQVHIWYSWYNPGGGTAF